MTPAQVIATQQRCSSGATNLPAPKPAVRAVVDLPLEPFSPSRTPEQILAKCAVGLRVFQFLDDLAAAGGGLPSKRMAARELGMTVEATTNAITALVAKGLIAIERAPNGRHIGIQIIGSGKWLRA